MDNSVIAKSGWLYRQTTIMKKWKKSWVELYRDGHLKYYENNQSPNAEDVIMMPTECLSIKTGAQVEGVQPPQMYNSQSLFSISSTTGKTWIFCGESLDDMRAWQLALEQARLFGVQQRILGQIPPPPYMHYGYQGVAPPPYPDHSLGYAAAGMPYSSQIPYSSQMPYYGYSTPSYTGVASNQPTAQTIIYQNQEPNRYYRHDGTNLAVGMLAGAALGSMMWAPLLWW